MKGLLSIVFVGSLHACGPGPDPLPPSEVTREAYLAYTRCIDAVVQRLELGAAPIGEQVEVVRELCERQRGRALRLKAVPVFAETEEEFDELHRDLARSLITIRIDGSGQ